jgi:type IV pilus assembly protein PilM
MEAAEEEKRENAVIMMDLLSGVGSAGDFAPASETPGPAATGRTPFDFSVDTPAAGASAYDDSATAIGGGGAFDLTDDAAAASPARPAVDLTDTSAADNPFVTPPAPPVDPAPSPFADVSPASAAATAPVPLASDPRAQRRREVFDAILPVLGEFVTELRRSIDYFRSRYPSDTVDQILLCGGSARIPQLDQFIQSDLGVPTVIADPFASVNVASRQVSSERLSDIAPAFAVAVGLATRDALLGGDK